MNTSALKEFSDLRLLIGHFIYVRKHTVLIQSTRKLSNYFIQIMEILFFNHIII